jgi:carotenoid cleavage dioxygenase
MSAFTAHPKVDAVTGEMMFFGYAPMPPYLQYSVVSASGELLRTVPIDIPTGVMIHDCAVTEHYTLLLDLPVTFNLEAMTTAEPLLNWNPDNGARIGIVPRHGTNDDVTWFAIPPCYVFHTTNAYEDGDEVVLIACRANSTNVLMDAGQPPQEGQADQSPRMHRWRFNMKTGTVTEEGLDDVPSEFPRINESLLGRQHRYSYSARFPAGASMPLFEGFQKYDHERGTIESHLHGKNRYGGEGVFVPRDGAKAEDDGWVVTYVHDEISDSAEMVVVSAQDMTAAPVARVLIPARVPYGFHAAWVAGEHISA